MWTIWIIFPVFWATSCYCQSRADSGSVALRVRELRYAFMNLSAAPSNLSLQEEYFKSFPNNFEEFNAIFGYSKDSKGKVIESGLLCKESESFVEAFFQLKEIERYMFYERVIDVSKNGYWDADGVNYFSHGMHELVLSDVDNFSSLLSRRSLTDIEGFWTFFFDGPHPEKLIPTELERIRQINPNVYNVLMRANRKAVNKSNH